MQLTIGRKLGLGFGAVLMLMGISALFVLGRINHLVDGAIPLDKACYDLKEHIDDALAASHGHAIVGGAAFLEQYEAADKEILRVKANLEALTETAMDDEERRYFRGVASEVAALEEAANRLRASTQAGDKDGTPEIAEGASYAERMLNALTEMINDEGNLEATPERKALLTALADSRGALAVSASELRTFVITGELQYRDVFDEQWAKNTEAFGRADRFQDAMTERQLEHWQSYTRNRRRFESQHEHLFTLRETVTTINEEVDRLTALADKRLLDAAQTARTTLSSATLLAIGIGCLVAFLLSRSIATAVSELAEHANQIAAGNLSDEPIQVASQDELGQLAQSFNVMTVNLREMIGTMSSQEETLTAEARSTAIFQAAADAIITIDQQGLIQSFNPAAEEMFGYKAEEAVGQNVAMLTPSPYREEHDGYLTRYRTTGEPHIIGIGRELQGVRKDGSTFDVWLRVRELKLEGETIFIGTIADISARIRTQNAIRDAVNRLGVAMQQILSTTTQQSTGAEEQAAAVSQTVTTAEQVRQIAEESAERANEMATSALRTGEIGEAGRQAVQDSIAAMAEVQRQVESLASGITSLAERAQAIGEITETVNDIAERTNVLALNAAVEASRAGEHGRGFKVVATQVKDLAEQSKKATSQVHEILGEIQQATTAAVLSTEDGTKAVARASQVVSQAGETISALSSTIGEPAQTAKQISASASQQATGVTQLNLGINNIDKVTRENVLAIQQIEQSARDLSALSSELASLTA